MEPIGAKMLPPSLLGVWPGLEAYLSSSQQSLMLIRCDRIARPDGLALGPDCIVGRDNPSATGNAADTTTPADAEVEVWADGTVYLERKEDDEGEELQAVLRELGLEVVSVTEILGYRPRSEMDKARAKVRGCPTDAETTPSCHRRGQIALWTAEESAGHTRYCAGAAERSTDGRGSNRDLSHRRAPGISSCAGDRLDPPKQWAGTRRAVEFVQSLGFGAEWAGERNRKRDSFIEVEGPYSLPPLHDYQRTVVEKLRHMLRGQSAGGARRGMISMPTGSGKTRVAVQAIVEAMREDGYNGGVLWVADRDELCEQAVESWRQVWSSIGVKAAPLRISRMWAGQPQPLPTSDRHVIVATVQTLKAKIMTKPCEFLADFGLIVFDEAHRSVAPTYTSVMQELGLTRWQRAAEPRLLGLTATPYRGHDEAETRWLVRRYSSNRLDAGAFASDDPEDVIRELQAMRVLAQADHDTIEGGRFYLNADELRQMEQNPGLPPPSAAEHKSHAIPAAPNALSRGTRNTSSALTPNGRRSSLPPRSSTPRPSRRLLNRMGVRARLPSVERLTHPPAVVLSRRFGPGRYRHS